MLHRRTYFQNEPGWLVESVLISMVVFGAQAFGFVLLLIEGVRGFPNARVDPGPFISFPIILLAVPLIMYPEIFSRFSWNVHLDEEKVWMKGDAVAAKWYRIQLPVTAKYAEIESISIEFSSKNSSGQSIRTWFYGPIWSKKRYLVLKMGRDKKRLHVTHFTDATLAIIIDTIAERCEKAASIYDGRRAAQILFNL